MSLEKVLKQLEFKWKRIKRNRAVLSESHDIREERIACFRDINQCRKEDKNIVYVDKSFILHILQRSPGMTNI
jgi:hypothetical protein